jgi:CheY-like chemotaxis protein
MSAATTKHVLLVDDEESLAWSLSNRLAKVRPQLVVATANDGDVALARLRQQPADLLIADVRMPGMSGTELILEARRTFPALPVVIMTAFRSVDVQRLAHSALTSFLEKPFAFDQLLAQVDRFLEGSPVVGFSGAVSVQTLPEIVQLYVLSSQTGALRIKHHSGVGEIFFQQGTVTHAGTSHGLVGEAAFMAIMLWSGGEFAVRMGETAPQRTISTSWAELVMEGCRQVDERKRDLEGRPSRSGWTIAPPAVADDLDFDFGDLAPPVEPVHPVTQPMGDPRVDRSDSPEEHMNIKDSLAKLNTIDGFVGAALVDAESGMLLGQEGGGALNLEVAAAGNT